jgi:hypothetical protein
LALLTPCPLVADEPTSEAKASALRILQGEWIQQWALLDGRRLDPERRQLLDGSVLESKTTLKIGYDKYIWQFPEGRPSFGGTAQFKYELNVASQPWVIRENGSQFPDNQPRAMIVRITGDKLEMCHYLDSRKWDTPPSTFDGSKGSGQILVTLKRVKIAEPDKEKTK